MPPNLTVATDTTEARKARGAFFTPSSVAQFIVDWAVRGDDDAVLEPSCGEAAFLEHAVRRLASLAAQGSTNDLRPPKVDGVEIHAESARKAERVVRENGGDPSITVADFFTLPPEPRYSAVVGNPPYIRYQDFSGLARLRSQEAALRAGVPMSGLASSWAAFTIHSALFLKRGGRLGLVVPAELLSVNYAAEVRRFLFDRFETVTLVMFTERVFLDAQEEVVLVLAEGYEDGPTDHAVIHQVHNAADLSNLATATKWSPKRAEDKWTPSLLLPDALSVYDALLSDHRFNQLQEWGDTTLGMVTGANRFFAMSPSRAKELGLTHRELIRLSPPGSSHLRGLSLSDHALRELGNSGLATRLFRPTGDVSKAAQHYIELGEATGVHEAYKCRVRSPWWRVPLVRPAHLILTYMNADTPRITTNSANAHHLNSVHGVYLRPGLVDLGQRLLPIASLNSMTMVGAEAVGRAYGGGILKLEPREADVLPVPSPEAVVSAAPALQAIRSRVAANLRAGRLLEAVHLVDRVLLEDAIGVRREQVRMLQTEYVRLATRRNARSASARVQA
ncbi:N-6 DNA methylase [Agromyces sp. SYSU T0242]|uniref:N-6 DNA methylase n=1 Tax=Agromyces litoreus TaxID=3158561 RepID=UPI003396F21B